MGGVGESPFMGNNGRHSQGRRRRDRFLRRTDGGREKKEGKTNEKKKRRHKAEPTRLGRVRAVDLGEGSRAGAALARVLLLAGAPPPVVELLAIRLLAPSEHAHRPAGLLHHVHDAVEHLAVGEAIARVNSSGSVLVPLIHCFEDVLL